MQDNTELTAFDGPTRLATGNLKQVAIAVKEYFKDKPVDGVLVFDNTRCQVVDIDFRGTAHDVLARIEAGASAPAAVAVANSSSGDSQRGPGRPKLGVVAKEVTLLPRHWEWLGSQPGGASVALRKLVEEARRINVDKDRIRSAQECSYRFMSTALGHEAKFEEASRALFAGDRQRFAQLVDAWPVDLRDHLKRLAEPAFAMDTGGDEK
jgi:hypothetical protein